MKRLEKASRVHIVSSIEEYRPGVEQERNVWMVDNSGLLVTIWNGTTRGGTWNCLQHARRVKRETKFLKWRGR